MAWSIGMEFAATILISTGMDCMSLVGSPDASDLSTGLRSSCRFQRTGKASKAEISPFRMTRVYLIAKSTEKLFWNYFEWYGRMAWNLQRPF